MVVRGWVSWDTCCCPTCRIQNEVHDTCLSNEMSCSLQFPLQNVWTCTWYQIYQVKICLTLIFHVHQQLSPCLLGETLVLKGTMYWKLSLLPAMVAARCSAIILWMRIAWLLVQEIRDWYPAYSAYSDISAYMYTCDTDVLISYI